LSVSALAGRAGSFEVGPIDLTVAAGRVLALLGPSGAGKTMLLETIAGLRPQHAGQIRLAGADLTAVPAERRRIGLVFQHYALFRHMSVFENVAFGLRVKPRHERPSKAEIAARVERLLELVQLAPLAKRLPNQLSGGQRQRVALARALAIEPRLLLPVLCSWLAVLLLTGYVGLASMLAGVALVIAVYAWQPGNTPLLIFCLAVALFVIFTHRGNIARMRSGTEHRVSKLWLFRSRAA